MRGARYARYVRQVCGVSLCLVCSQTCYVLHGHNSSCWRTSQVCLSVYYTRAGHYWSEDGQVQCGDNNLPGVVKWY